MNYKRHSGTGFAMKATYTIRAIAALAAFAVLLWASPLPASGNRDLSAVRT